MWPQFPLALRTSTNEWEISFYFTLSLTFSICLRLCFLFLSLFLLYPPKWNNGQIHYLDNKEKPKYSPMKSVCSGLISSLDNVFSRIHDEFCCFCVHSNFSRLFPALFQNPQIWIKKEWHRFGIQREYEHLRGLFCAFSIWWTAMKPTCAPFQRC